MKILDKKLQNSIKWYPHDGGQDDVLNCENKEVIVCAGRGWGKALDITTPILTDKGFKNMGLIENGDMVFGEDGLLTKVIANTEIMEGRPCYRITFSDGSSLIADEEHLWKVEKKNQRKGLKLNTEIKTTKDLLKDYFKIRNDGKKESNYSIRTAEPISFPEKELKIPPYILGAWLGDGTSSGSGFTTADIEILEEFKKLGYDYKEKNTKYHYLLLSDEFTQKRNGREQNKIGLYKKLREIGVLGNKHIPDNYKYSSIEQRLELLKGLMDTDGYCEENGRMEYVGVNKQLCEDVNFIINSLGIKSSFYEYDCRLYGRYICKKYRIHFKTDIPVFHLKRKLERQKDKTEITKRRFIKKIEPIDSVPVKCIEVDNESKMYLAGKQLVPTHNSMLMAYIVLKTLLEKAPTGECKIFIVAPTYKLTEKVFQHFAKMLRARDKRLFQFISGGGNRPYEFKKSVNIWVQCISTTEASGLLGERVDLLVVDEAAMIPKKIYIQGLRPAIARKGSKAYYIGTPRGEGWFKTKFYILKDLKAAFQFKSTDGVITSEEYLEEEKKEYPELLFKQEFLAEFISDAGSVFKAEKLEKIAIPNIFQDVVPGHHYVMGIDIAKEKDYTVITVIDTNTKRVVHKDRFKGWDFPYQKQHIIAKAQRYNNARVILDTTGLGAPIYEDLRQSGIFVEDFTFSGKKKEELFSKCRIFLENGYVSIPNKEEYPELWDELLNFEYKYLNEKTGEPLRNIQYGPPSGFHDDCVDSLALAIWGLIDGKAVIIDPISRELAKNTRNKLKSFI